ncbi:MAG: hypothetical protein ACHQJ6_05535 [Candidatus Berkiellales bacterium]
MKRGLFLSEDPSSHDTTAGEALVTGEPHPKHLRIEMDKENQQIYFALSALKAGNNKAWDLLEAECKEQGKAIVWNALNFHLAFQAKVAGHSQAWDYIWRQFMDPTTQGYFEALESCFAGFRTLSWEKRYALRVNRSLITLPEPEDPSLKLIPRAIKDDTEEQNLTSLADEGLGALYQKICQGAK